jgi:dihydropteroate synthase
MILRCRDRVIDLAARPRVMGILNVTPDSFSDGGLHLDPAAAIARAEAMAEEGADLLDVGAESTRPGSEPVPAAEQWRRLEPVLSTIAALGPVISIDTANAEVAERAIEAGAHCINDVTALGDPGMAGVIAAAGAGAVLMHMRGTPATMQEAPQYDDVIADVAGMLGERVRRAIEAGIAAECVAVDPGIGFGKTAAHNLDLLAGLDRLRSLHRPIVVGLSRKRFIGHVLDREVDERLEGGLAATAVAVFQGADIIRTHDVRATVAAVTMAAALRGRRGRETAPIP